MEQLPDKAAGNARGIPEEEIDAAIDAAIEDVRKQRRERRLRTGKPDLVDRKVKDLGSALRRWVAKVCGREPGDEEYVSISVEEASTDVQPQETYPFIEKVMAEDDANDPHLASYQGEHSPKETEKAQNGTRRKDQ